MTEFEVYEKSLKRMLTKIDEKNKCEVVSHKSNGTINVYNYYGMCFLTFEFNEQGDLINLDTYD